MADTGIVTGLLAAPLLGVVTEEDADSAVVIDMARNILGNPYGDELGGAPDALPAGGEDSGSGEPQSSEPTDSGPLVSDDTHPGVPDGGVDSSPTTSPAEDGVGSETTGTESSPE